MSPISQDGIRKWREHPVTMVRDLFNVEPDAWQRDTLEAFPHSPRIAMKACKGPGKTACLAWIGWNFLLTRPHPMIGATSISGANLKANLWAELARWRARSQILINEFEQTKTEIFHRQFPQTWKIEARTWAADADDKQIGNALAGLHAEYVMWLADESGDYPSAILPTLEGIFAGLPKEAHIVQAGNPTRVEGPLYHACTTARNMWKVIEITADPDDPNRTPRVSIEHAREQIQQYGRDNPWVMINILGKFPPGSINALIGPDEIKASFARFYRQDELRGFAKVLGIDVAREGDDASVMFPRQGRQAFPPTVWRNIDSIQGAGAVARKIIDWEADGVFIDNTGGFGSGWIDQLRVLGQSPIPVVYSEKAVNPRYANKRAEIYFSAVEWIKTGGALPECPELLAAMTRTNYTFQKDRLLLEPKDAVKVKLGYSPDHADAFCQTFAAPITPKNPMILPGRSRHTADYDPFAAANNLGR